MLTEQEFNKLEQAITSQKLGKAGILKFIKETLVVAGPANTRDPSGYTVPINTGIKSDGADKGASIMTAKSSRQNDRRI